MAYAPDESELGDLLVSLPLLEPRAVQVRE